MHWLDTPVTAGDAVDAVGAASMAAATLYDEIEPAYTELDGLEQAREIQAFRQDRFQEYVARTNAIGKDNDAW